MRTSKRSNTKHIGECGEAIINMPDGTEATVEIDPDMWVDEWMEYYLPRYYPNWSSVVITIIRTK